MKECPVLMMDINLYSCLIFLRAGFRALGVFGYLGVKVKLIRL